jgi:Restriction endonuclease
VHVPPDLRERLLEIRELPSTKRWSRFEALLYTLFKRGHFRVERASGAARRRQLDLVASTRDSVYFVEAKWHKEPLGPGDVDGLFSRLDGAAPGTIGVLVSPSGFTDGLIHEVKELRRKSVLLFGPGDIADVFAAPDALRPRLRRKLDHFRVVGDVLVGANDAPLGDPPSRFALNPPPIVLDPDGRQLPWVSSPGNYGSFVFADELTDVDWTPRRGRGASIDFRPDVWSIKSLTDLLDELHERAWLTLGATWSIEQFDTNWHGFGHASLIDALRSYGQRYQLVNHVHHTEQVCITDSFNGMLVVLNVDVSAQADRSCSSANLSIHLGGVPVDAEPYERLAEVVADDGPLEFRVLEGPAVSQFFVPREGSHVSPVAFVVEERPDDEEFPLWVRGIVVENPYPNGIRFEEGDGRWWPDGMNDSRLMVCHLSSWHPWREAPAGYAMRHIEWAYTTDYAIVRPVADWRGELRARGV